MAGLKRLIYGLPVMSTYRAYRTRRLAKRFRDHPLGFHFAGSDTFFRDDWETHERAVILDQLERAAIFIDVGANQGIYTCLAAAKGRRAVAVEPEAGNLRFLLANLKVNHFAAEVYAVALADKPGVATIYGDGDTASLVMGWSGASESFSQLVPANTLDNLFGARWLDEDIFIKIDVEGLELAVLKAAGKLLNRRRKPAWLIETLPRTYDRAQSENPNFAAVFQTMFDAGYVCRRAHVDTNVIMQDVHSWARSSGDFNIGGSNYLFTAAD